MQLKPILRYTWDNVLEANTGTASSMDLSANGISRLAPATECKVGQCVLLPNTATGGFFNVPAYNYGQHPGLTVSLWFKPMPTSGSWARIIDFGPSTHDKNWLLARHSSFGGFQFNVRRPGNADTYALMTQSSSSWVENRWQHIVWSLKPTSATKDMADWVIYLDGVKTYTWTGYYPANELMQASQIGRAGTAGEASTKTVGYMDSFMVFPFDVTDVEAWLLYTVSSLHVCMRLHMHVKK